MGLLHHQSPGKGPGMWQTMTDIHKQVLFGTGPHCLVQAALKLILLLPQCLSADISGVC